MSLQKHLKIFRFNCHICHKEGRRMGFATRKRLYRHMAFAHNVNPEAEFENEENRDLILNPPPLIEQSAEKSRRGRRKGAKNRLKLDPDTGQLVRTLFKKAKVKKEPAFRKAKPRREKANDPASAAASALWTVATWPPNFPH